MCSCHSIPECCVMFSGVKLSMGLFALFIIIVLNFPHKDISLSRARELREI